ncbi:hypothetical protein GWK36_12115 [Caldichromatium japonicum]|uniref:Uncharacterized protein n=1 Tax=Caldichromatium japonicum TaxID=2699430 RepID=A0A6G7VF73_9GAMM|nr:hypothetical protein [Caldichromatium japonicum]QIK38602.1 hypothetical protein GWK36_12115 [Caldichromatium japonicum]
MIGGDSSSTTTPVYQSSPHSWLKGIAYVLMVAFGGALLAILGLWLYLNMIRQFNPDKGGAGWINLREVLDLLIADWSASGAWTGRSINFNQGGLSNPNISAVLNVALWIGLSSLLTLVTQRARRSTCTYRTLCIAFILAGWLALDLRWQFDLCNRAQRSIGLYAGVTEPERQAVGPDRAFYPFIRDVLAHLPPQPARIFIITEQPASALVGRVRYHMLPHITSLGLTSLPHLTQSRSNDYVLVITPVQQVRYDQARKRLIDGQTEWPVEPVFNSRLGSLFRVQVDGL